MVSTGLEYTGVSRISGPIIIVENVKDVGYDELVEVIAPNGEKRLGKVLKITKKIAVVQIF